MITLKCEFCGKRYPAHDEHKCARKEAAKDFTETISVDSDSINEIVDAAIGLDRMTILVGVRITTTMAKKLDKKRGGMTRPAKIREILEREL